MKNIKVSKPKIIDDSSLGCLSVIIIPCLIIICSKVYDYCHEKATAKLLLDVVSVCFIVMFISLMLFGLNHLYYYVYTLMVRIHYRKNKIDKMLNLLPENIKDYEYHRYYEYLKYLVPCGTESNLNNFCKTLINREKLDKFCNYNIDEVLFFMENLHKENYKKRIFQLLDVSSINNYPIILNNLYNSGWKPVKDLPSAAFYSENNNWSDVISIINSINSDFNDKTSMKLLDFIRVAALKKIQEIVGNPKSKEEEISNKKNAQSFIVKFPETASNIKIGEILQKLHHDASLILKKDYSDNAKKNITNHYDTGDYSSALCSNCGSNSYRTVYGDGDSHDGLGAVDICDNCGRRI